MRSHTPTSARGVVLDRDADTCQMCGKHIPPGSDRSVHHRRPTGMGGSRDPLSSDPSNLVLICGSGVTGCHGEIESDRGLSLVLGWLVPQSQDPRTVPVWHADEDEDAGIPMWLSADGWSLDPFEVTT